MLIQVFNMFASPYLGPKHQIHGPNFYQQAWRDLCVDLISKVINF